MKIFSQLGLQTTDKAEYDSYICHKYLIFIEKSTRPN